MTERQRTNRSRTPPKPWFSPSDVMAVVTRFASGLADIVANSVLILLTVVFIHLEAAGFRRKYVSVFNPSPETMERIQGVIEQIHHYVRIKTWVSLWTGGLVGLWLWGFGISYPMLWALVAFLLNYIPNIGSVVAAVPVVLLTWIEHGEGKCLGVIAGYTIVNGIFGGFLEPRWLGKSLGVSPLIVFVSLVFWGWVLGPTGMLFSVPLTMTAMIAMEGFDDTRWLATMMSGADDIGDDQSKATG